MGGAARPGARAMLEALDATIDAVDAIPDTAINTLASDPASLVAVYEALRQIRQ